MPGLLLTLDVTGNYSNAQHIQFRIIINETADVFARELGTSVRFLFIFTPTASPSRWACFEVIRGRAVQKHNQSCSRHWGLGCVHHDCPVA